MASVRRVRFSFDEKSLLQIYVLLKDYQSLEECLKTQEYDVNNGNYLMSFFDHKNAFIGWTPLHVSANINDTKSATILLRYGADSNARTAQYSYTPLHIAILSNSQEMCQLLIDWRADPNIKSTAKQTLELCLDNQYLTTFLIESGAQLEINYTEKHPLIFRAMDAKNLSLVQFLSKQQKKCFFYQNKYPIEYAIDVFPECVHHLIESGQQIHYSNTETGEYPIHLAIQSNKYEWIEMLCEMGCDTNVANKEGDRPLHIAIKNDCSEQIILLLIAFNANPNLKNIYGLTPICYAVQKENENITQVLMEMQIRLSRNLSELERSIRYKKFKSALILLQNIKTIDPDIEFDSEPIIWFFVKHCVAEHDSNAKDLIEIMQKLIDMTNDFNAIDNIWGSLGHFLIYADVCAPTHCFKPLFDVLIRSNKYDINYEFTPKDTRSKTGEPVPVERIMANGTALSFALEMPNCEYYAEQLIKVGADYSTINWDHIFFAPKKAKALKMLIYSGCAIPDYFREYSNPLYDESLDNNVVDNYSNEFEKFISWWNRRQTTCFSLKQMSRKAVRKTIGSKALQKLTTNGPQIFGSEFETFPQTLSDYILYESYEDFEEL